MKDANVEKEKAFADKVRKAETNLESHNDDVAKARASAEKATGWTEPREGGPESVSKANAKVVGHQDKLARELKKTAGEDPERALKEFNDAVKLAGDERKRHDDVKRNFNMLTVEKKVR